MLCWVLLGFFNFEQAGCRAAVPEWLSPNRVTPLLYQNRRLLLS